MMKSTLIAIAVFCLATGVRADTTAPIPQPIAEREEQEVPITSREFGCSMVIAQALQIDPACHRVGFHAISFTRYEAAVYILRIIDGRKDEINALPNHGARLKDFIYAFCLGFQPEIHHILGQEKIDFRTLEFIDPSIQADRVEEKN